MDTTITDTTKVVAPIDPKIDAGLIGNTNGITVPPAPEPTNLLAGLASTTQQTADQSTAQESTAQNDFTNLLKQLEGQTTDIISAENQQNLPGLNKELLDLQKVANKQTAEYIAGYAGQEAKRQTRQETTVAQQNLTRQNAIDALLTNSLISAKQGDITFANSLVDRAIKAKYDPLKARIETQKEILRQVEGKASQDRQTALNLQLKKIEKQEKDEATKESYIIKAGTQNAPADLIKKAREAKTAVDAVSILGEYAGDILDTQLKKAQIAKTWSDARKVDTTSGILTEGQLKQIDTSPQGKKLQSLSNLYQLSNTYKKLVDLNGFKVKGDQKAIMDRAYADLKIAYKEAANLGALTGPDIAVLEEAIKPTSGGASKYLNYKLAGGKGGVTGAIESGLASARNEALKNYKQLKSRNPNYEQSEYVQGLITPFAKDYSVVNVDTVGAGEIIQTEDGILLESLGNGQFSPL